MISKKDFLDIYSRFYKRVFSFIAKQTSFQAAEDIVQETFLKIYLNWESYDHNKPLINWIFTIAKNTVFDHLRRVQRNSEVELEPDMEPINFENAETKLSDEMDHKELLNIIGQLPSLRREAMSYRIIQGLSLEEITKKMNTTLSSVKCLLHRAEKEILDLVKKKIH